MKYLALTLLAALTLAALPAAAQQTLYVSNGNGSTIEKITPSGVASVFANTGLNDP